MALSDDVKQQWKDLVARPHRDQAIFFLNGFWGVVKGNAEQIWEYTLKFEELAKSGSGSDHDLDEFFSHKFLEDVGEVKTVLQLRATLSELDVDKNKRMAISEYLLFKYGQNAKDLVTSPQGDSDELAKAQALYEEASAALDDVMKKLEASKKAAADAKAAEAAAAAAAEEAKRSLAELQKQEEAYKNKCDTLRKKSEEGGVVSRNKAKNELEQLLAEDPLPLRQAKITQEAAVRKNEKARKAAEEARIAAEAAAAALEESAKAAEAARDEAVAYLNKVKNSGAGAGKVWFNLRALYEKQQYLPKAKQTMSYPDP
eukprot:CAMPEP_0119131118 /NCGR_PEP_ID=MMETSP1310-20130426/9491_1 /TAXON_ID=464262 /ORGANISM="Genus nov. species nov., Strain RCC2339" /LENGTH=314 /DNA_ID=CAMNT_0007121671 /DNA_START=57 /DNA_END=1001 /DNA_ORIENTATION=+